jgi:hypothetical protein
MKKILLSFALLGLLIGLIVPMLALAMTMPDSCTMKKNVDAVLGAGNCPDLGGTIGFADEFVPGGPTGAFCCMFSSLLYVTDMVFLVLMVLVVILILAGAFSIMTAGGNPESVGKGRNFIVYALVGVVIALLAKALPFIMRSILGF